MSGWKVRVENDFIEDGIAIYLCRVAEDGIEAMQPVELVTRTLPANASPIAPAIKLSQEAAVALYHSLCDYYGHTGDVRMLKLDLERERRRSDLLTEHLAEMMKIMLKGDCE